MLPNGMFAFNSANRKKDEERKPKLKFCLFTINSKISGLKLVLVGRSLSLYKQRASRKRVYITLRNFSNTTGLEQKESWRSFGRAAHFEQAHLGLHYLPFKVSIKYIFKYSKNFYKFISLNIFILRIEKLRNFNKSYYFGLF